MLKVTVLTENLVRQRYLLAEHGLSLWIEDESNRLLFDTGQTDVYLRNASHLGIDISLAESIVLSHGHYDHGGGLTYLPKQTRWPQIFLHPDALLPKFRSTTNQETPLLDIGFPWHTSDLVDVDKHMVFNTGTMQIGENMYIVAGIPQTTPFEIPPTNFFTKKDGRLVTDTMLDEQVLVYKGKWGLVVFLGCSHPGVINCLLHVQNTFPEDHIHAVIGGMHLEKVSAERLQTTFAIFKDMRIKHFLPLHCTGQNVIWQMKGEFGEKMHIHRTGERFVLKE